MRVHMNEEPYFKLLRKEIRAGNAVLGNAMRVPVPTNPEPGAGSRTKNPRTHSNFPKMREKIHLIIPMNLKTYRYELACTFLGTGTRNPLQVPVPRN